MLQPSLFDAVDAVDENVEPTEAVEAPEVQDAPVETSRPLVHPEDVVDELDDDYELEPQTRTQPQGSSEPSVAELQQQIAELRALLSSKPSESSKAETSERVLPSSDDLPFDMPTAGAISLVGPDEDVTDLTMSAEGLNSLASRIIDASVQASLRYGYVIAQRQANRAVAINEYSKTFYTRYPELRDKASRVKEISDLVETENPNLTPQQFMVEVAKRAYAETGQQMPSSQNVRKPGFTKHSGTSGAPAPRTANQGTNDVLDLVRRKRGY